MHSEREGSIAQTTRPEPSGGGPRASNPEQAARALVHYSYAILHMPDDVFSHAYNILDAGRRFFEQPLEVKTQRRSAADDLEGYRSFGEELDPETGLEDLSEGFAVWRRNQHSEDVRRWARSCELHGLMSNALDAYATLAEDILSALRREVAQEDGGAAAGDINIRALSYLQQNYYRPADHAGDGRANVMEPHEDGHVLTILKPTAPGLAVSPRELIEPPTPENRLGVYGPPTGYLDIDLGPREAIVIPSTPTALLTGGLVKPLWHGVRNTGSKRRQSLMFFVNPDPAFSCRPWVRNRIFAKYDIHEIIDIMSSNYGKTSISQVM